MKIARFFRQLYLSGGMGDKPRARLVHERLARVSACVQQGVQGMAKTARRWAK
jgi:hypothetical protein